MSLLLGVPPIVARDFSFSIQSFGMTVASLTIFGLSVPMDYEALIWASLGGTLGLAVGLVGIAPLLSPTYSKMWFVSVWLTFAVALYKLNSRGRDRRVYCSSLDADLAVLQHNGSNPHDNKQDTFQDNDDDEQDTGTKYLTEDEAKSQRARRFVLCTTGFVGGICSSIVGSGLDITTFSILTLFYRVSEKVATPTSVVLMGLNAVFGVFFRFVIGLGGAPYPEERQIVWNFVSVCIPIVVIGGPIGATIASRVERHWLAYVIYVLNSIQFVSAMFILHPWSQPYPDNWRLSFLVAGTLILGTTFFVNVAAMGNERGDCSPNESMQIEELDKQSYPRGVNGSGWEITETAGLNKQAKIVV
jgi:uncharacterized protein